MGAISAIAAARAFISFIQIYFVNMLQLMYDLVIWGVLLLFQVIKGMAYKMPSFNLSHQYTTCFSWPTSTFSIALLCRLCFALFHDMVICTLKVFYFSFNSYQSVLNLLSDCVKVLYNSSHFRYYLQFGFLHQNSINQAPTFSRVL